MVKGKKGADAFAFAGVDAPNTTPMPDVYFDVLFPLLGKGQLKVLLYLTRRIFGFKKEGDTISLSQICSGIRRRDGTVLDRGTGLSRHAATAAIRQLEEMGVIVATRGVSSEGDPAPTYYTLRFRESLSVKDLLQQRSSQTVWRFPGIDSPNTTPVPDSYFDLLLPELGLAEWRVLLYVVRRTLGFKKLSDAISLDQFTTGVTTREGSKLDAGTGLSRSNVHEALNQLVMRNVLVRQRVHDPRTGDGVSIFSLTMREDVRHSMGSVLGLAPGPLRAAATGAATQADGVLLRNQRRVPEMPYQGVPQMPHPRRLQSNHPGVLESPYPITQPAPEEVSGVPLRDHPRSLESPHPRVLPGNHRGSQRVPAAGGDDPLPPGTLQAPQETDLQETARQNERSSSGSPYAALVAQIAADLGTRGSTTPYTSRVDALAATASLQGPAFFEALLTAWKITAGRLQSGHIDQPGAAMHYWLTVVQDLLAKGNRRTAGRSPSVRPGDTTDLQDRQFVTAVLARVAILPSQDPWISILQGMAETQTRGNYTRWFARSVLFQVDTSLTVIVGDALQQQWLSTRLHDVVHREARNQGIELPVVFVTLADLA
jgi:hypothetical protein